jgi:regulator of protease activity HflC (stomatin/prohibitin superfamily)
VRGAPPHFFRRLVSSKRARRELSLLAGILGLLLILGVSGARVVREDIGHVGVIRNGAPWSNRAIHKIIGPGDGPVWAGWFSQAPREYPASQVAHTYTITADPDRGSRTGVDVVTVPTKDGVQIGLEATVFYHFTGERDPDALKTFDRSIGTRQFRASHGGPSLYPWQGDEGWDTMIDSLFRPILENIVRGEIGRFQCGQLVPSCVLIHQVRPVSTFALNEPRANIARAEAAINRALAADLADTLNGRYFWRIHFRIARVALPANVQAAINTAQASYAGVANAEAKARQARYQNRANELLAKTYNKSPALAKVEQLKSIPKGSTVILSGSSKIPQVLAGTGH